MVNCPIIREKGGKLAHNKKKFFLPITRNCEYKLAHRRWIRLIVSQYCKIKRCQIGKKIDSKGKLTPDQTQEENLPHTIYIILTLKLKIIFIFFLFLIKPLFIKVS